MAQDNLPPDGEAARHEQARRLAEAALREEDAGNEEEAERLFDEAERIDPEAVANALREHDRQRRKSIVPPPQDDAEIAAMSRQIEPGSAAPSRAGIIGDGSGADAER